MPNADNDGEPSPVDPECLCVLTGQVEQLPPTQLLDLLDRRRHDERLLGLLGSAAKLVLKDPQGCSPRIRPALVEMLVQDAERLRYKLIQGGAASLLDRRLLGASAESSRADPSLRSSAGVRLGTRGSTPG